MNRNEIPKGFTMAQNIEQWHVGYVFEWSPVFEGWVDTLSRISVRPNESVGAAYYRQKGLMPPNMEIFLRESF